MRAAGLFAPDGDFYNMVTRRLAELDSDFQLSGHLVYHALVDLLALGKIELGEEVTDAWLQANSPWLKGKSRSFIQKGLHALEGILGLIGRIRQHGRRIIRFVLRLRGRGGSVLPPQTPPKDFEQTTTEGRSSSSQKSGGKGKEEAAGPVDPAIAGLVARACRLVPEATPGQVATAIGKFTAEWVALALDRVEKRNRTPGKVPVESWGFVLRILLNRRHEGWTPPEPEPKRAPAPPATRVPQAPPEPSPALSAEEVAALVAATQSGPPTSRRVAATRLRVAAREGAIAAELVATIPAGILDPEDPRAP
jgi:hypothetical protein